MLTEKEEQRRLKNILKRIEQRRKAKEKGKNENLASIITAKQLVRAKKKAIKAGIVQVPNAENDEFIDKNIAPIQEEDNSKRKHITDVSKVEGFTVLGTENFKKKTEVR